MRRVIFFLLLSVFAIRAHAACGKLVMLDDGHDNVYAYVVPDQIVSLSGSDSTTRIIFRNGTSIDVPVAIKTVFARISQGCPQ
jgi:hypothetical protein